MNSQNSSLNKDSPITLHKVITAFQKSLARASQLTAEASYSDSEYSLGQRSLYAVDAIELNISAGFSIKESVDNNLEGDKVLVNFNAPSDQRSHFQFRVEAKPLEQVDKFSIILSRKKPIDETYPVNHFVIWVFDEEGNPLPGYEVKIKLFADGIRISNDEKLDITLTYQTDPLGKIYFTINLKDGTLWANGMPKKKTVDLSKKIDLKSERDWFIRAETVIRQAEQTSEPEILKTDIFPVVKQMEK